MKYPTYLKKKDSVCDAGNDIAILSLPLGDSREEEGKGEK